MTIRSTLSTFIRRNIIAPDPHPQLSRLDVADGRRVGLSDVECDRLLAMVGERARA